MDITTTITQKGQLTLPVKIRRQLGLKNYSKVKLVVEADYVKIVPTSDIIDLAGTVKPRIKKSVLKAREAFDKTYTRK